MKEVSLGGLTATGYGFSGLIFLSGVWRSTQSTMYYGDVRLSTALMVAGVLLALLTSYGVIKPLSK